MRANKYTLRALALLLGYPDAGLRSVLPALVDAIDEEAALRAGRRAEIRALAAELLRSEPIAAEERYVGLFEHVHGDARERGPAMIDLLRTYEGAGLHLGARELPDHLCVVLEFASTQPPAVARAFLAEMAHILQAIFSALRARGSAYAALLAAVLELAGEKVQAVPVTPDEALDATWSEPPAFGGCSNQGQAAPGQPQPIRIVRRGAPRGASA